jgi:hypothetical protein
VQTLNSTNLPLWRLHSLLTGSTPVPWCVVCDTQSTTLHAALTDAYKNTALGEPAPDVSGLYGMTPLQVCARVPSGRPAAHAISV